MKFKILFENILEKSVATAIKGIITEIPAVSIIAINIEKISRNNR